MVDIAAFKITKNVFSLPTTTDMTLMPFWTIEQQNQYFMLQKYQQPENTLFKSVFSTITNLFDVKQAQFRILFQREANASSLQIAASDSLQLIEKAWDLIRLYLLPELENFSNSFEKEEWLVVQLDKIVSNANKNDTDELVHDDDIRNTSRTFRQTFNVPSSERLVNYYSCSCNGRQGWMYISENFLGFYSYLIGFELKILIEIKNIKDIFKEKNKKIFRHSLRIKTKDDQEYVFSNMFKRDEVYDVLVQLAGDSIRRLLKNNKTATSTSPPLTTSTSPPLTTDPLKNILKKRKRDERFQNAFRLNEQEALVDMIQVHYIHKDPKIPNIEQRIEYPGTLYLSNNFITFKSREVINLQTDQPVCTFILPLYSITKFERINNQTYESALVLTTWHKMEHMILVKAEKTESEAFCELLKRNLGKNVVRIKSSLKTFLMTCKSEEMLKSPQIQIEEPIGGLGLQFGYKSDVNEEKDTKKLNTWKWYFKEHGRNLTLVRYPTFGKMVRIGVPNALRGEIWELCSGSIFLRFDQPDAYQEILDKYKDQVSPSEEDIEKDLHRSLPEYSAYQSPEGIDRLRRVLTAYSWKDPDIGYCQAMNIITSAMLIYMTEEQTFWTLNALVNQLCPGYYSSSMYGVLLDQMVLEELVRKNIPRMYHHLKEKDIQLSVACLPWFLTLYINSMPLPFAFRILDCFFLEGPKILFQIALAILKLHEKQITEVSDDSELLIVVKTFFISLNMPKKDISKEDDEANKLDVFKKLMRSAYTDFSHVTSEKINKLRKENELKVIGGVESFTKRNTLRVFKNKSNFTPEELGIIYDYFFSAVYYVKDEENELDLPAFKKLLNQMTIWVKKADEMTVIEKGLMENFVLRLFNHFAADGGGVTFNDFVYKLGDILRGDIMSQVAFLFSLFDTESTGKLLNADIMAMASELYWLMTMLYDDNDGSQKHHDASWDTVCSFITLTLEQSLENNHEKLEQLTGKLNTSSSKITTSLESHLETLHKIFSLEENENTQLELTLPSLRMIVLTDISLEYFLQDTLPRSFRLEKMIIEPQKSLGREIFETLFIEGKKLATAPSSPLQPTRSANRLSVSSSLSPNAPVIPERKTLRSPHSVQSFSSFNSSNKNRFSSDLEDFELI
ncbi:TBC-domain-containing protein [Backusella circina FSU 941]|nr:TBC-domain-containing protein [Backusella circina FSU 941]